MSDVPALIGYFFLAVTLGYCLPALGTIRGRRLKGVDFERLPEPEVWPKLSVIIAARDEAARIHETLTKLLASNYPQLEIVLADDRSKDDTGRIADEVAAQDQRLKVFHIRELPAGWIGKSHAMSCAAKIAEGEFLLFTDGDIQFAPQTLKQAMLIMLHRKLDHLCLMPKMEAGSWLERVLVSVFGMLFLLGSVPWLRKLKFPTAYYGIGAFNLVKRTTFERVGGFEPIKMDVLDDVKLGKLLYRHGASAELLLAGEALSVRWQNSAWGAITGLEKNGFAALEYSYFKLTNFTLLLCGLFFVPWVAVLTLPVERSIGWLIMLVLLHLTHGALSAVAGGGWLVMPGMSLGALGIGFAFWRSAALTLWRGGVRWRETFYSLGELKRGLY